MFETARKYSEYAYYNKEDLEKEMDHYLVEPLWAEIEKYRSFFRFEFPLQNKKSYLIRNPHVIDQMAITQEMMQGWLCTHGEIQDAQVDTFWLKEEEQHRFSRLFVRSSMIILHWPSRFPVSTNCFWLIQPIIFC